MRYHYRKPTIYVSMYGKLYICAHPVYSRCTLFKGIIISIGKERVHYKVYEGKHVFKDELVTYTMEIRLP